MSNEKIFCANCSNCLVVSQSDNGSDRYSLRVKCSKKQWNKKSGEEKFHKYFTAARRTMDECEYYEETGDLFPYIKNLRKELPIKDELYSPSTPH
jgi:hypothetical protein